MMIIRSLCVWVSLFLSNFSHSPFSQSQLYESAFVSDADVAFAFPSERVFPTHLFTRDIFFFFSNITLLAFFFKICDKSFPPYRDFYGYGQVFEYVDTTPHIFTMSKRFLDSIA